VECIDDGGDGGECLDSTITVTIMTMSCYGQLNNCNSKSEESMVKRRSGRVNGKTVVKLSL
jgi:hypothetical protein